MEIRDLRDDGSLKETASCRSASGTVITSTETITSADGLTKTIEIDANGDGFDDLKITNVTQLNTDGSRTKVVSEHASNGTLISRTVITASANSLVLTSAIDMNGDGVLIATEN